MVSKRAEKQWLYIEVQGVLPIPKGKTPEQFCAEVHGALAKFGILIGYHNEPSRVDIVRNDWKVSFKLQRLDKPLPEDE